MKGNKKQREKEAIKAKTKPPHSIGASAKVVNVSKKSQVIQKKPEKAATLQSKLITVKNENGSQSLLVSKASPVPTSSKKHETRLRSTAVAKTAQVEPKKIDRSRTEPIVNRAEPTSSAAESKDIVCKLCNLHFSSPLWLKKHMVRHHAGAAVVEDKSEAKVQIQKYKNQLDAIQQTMDKKTTTEKGKKSKISPSKQRLREQLKSQLAAQQKLLQVQQEIFEKTSKAQQDIFQLIAKLGDDSADEENDESGETEDDFKTEIQTQNEIYFETDTDAGELIVSDNVDEYTYANYEIEEELADNNYVLMNEQNVQSDVHHDQSVMVIVQSEEGEEEYELVDVIEDQMYETQNLDQIEGDIGFEIVGKDSNSVHCRIVANEDPEEEVEYVQVDRVPVKLEVDHLQQIAQKRFKKQLEGNANAESEDSKLLNATIHKSEKKTNEYIQKVVQNAVPSEDNKFECPICHEMVSNRYSLGPHILRLHSKQKSKICQYCDRSFTCTGDLTRHIRIHTGEKPFKCSYPHCEYAFRASGDLHKHMRRHNSTTINIRQHVCKQCDRAFERNYDLKRHELTHKKNEEGVGYNCEFCSKRFVRKDQHKAHVFRHLGIKQYKCPDCDRKFSDFSNCSKHIRQCQAGDVKPFGAEDNEPQYICEICDKRFKSKVGMKQHVLKCAQITELQKKLQDSIKQMEEE